MNLNVWTKSSIQTAGYSDAEGKSTVEPVRDGVRRTLQPRHIAWCTGIYSMPKPIGFQGLKQFKGTVYHGSQHYDASKRAGLEANGWIQIWI